MAEQAEQAARDGAEDCPVHGEQQAGDEGVDPIEQAEQPPEQRAQDSAGGVFPTVGGFKTDQLSKLKAQSSARYRWPTSFFVTMKKNGQDFPDVFVGGGGMPLVVGGKTVGAIGVSGAFDDAIAQAGVDALK